MAHSSSWKSPEGTAASQAKKLVIRLLEETDFEEHHLCEVSDAVEADDGGHCIREDCGEEGTERDRSS